MAEFASGAVSSLLGVIRNEAGLLGGVRNDVQFIKEEMESMSSFLAHLARTEPSGTGGEHHDEQVRTWMNHVRLLAQDCSNCIDLYVYHGNNPDIHRARGGLWRYLWWLPWLVQSIVPLQRHRVALHLRELKQRARDVSERRQRYDVKIPERASRSGRLTTQGGNGGEDDDTTASDDDDVQHQLVVARATTTDRRRRPRDFLFEPPSLGGYMEGKLVEWIQKSLERQLGGSTPSIAVMAPRSEAAAALALEVEALAARHLQCGNVILVDNMGRGRGTRLLPWAILCYILRKLQHAPSTDSESGPESKSEQKQGSAASERNKGGGSGTAEQNKNEEKVEGLHAQELEARRLWRWLRAAVNLLFIRQGMPELDEIMRNIEQMKVTDKIGKIKRKIEQMKQPDDQLTLELEQIKDGDLPFQLEDQTLAAEPLGVLHLALLLLELKSKPAAAAKSNTTATKQYQGSSKALQQYQAAVRKIATMIKDHMEILEEEEAKEAPLIYLHHTQYVDILEQVFPMAKPLRAEKQATEAPDSTATTLVEDQIKAISQGTVIEETIEKLGELHHRLEEQLKIKGLVDKISNHLNQERTLIILQTESENIYRWEETRNALSLLGCIIGAVIVTTKETTESVQEYCSPPWKPINYCLLGLYHDIVLDLTSQQKNEASNYDHKILYDILNKCGSHEFCMKMFAHALYTNPNRSYKALCKLDSALQDSPKSVDSIANKMFMFSYRDLTKEYRSCLLHLAIFPSGCNLRRSTLMGRWVAEGLINKEDWHHSVHWASRCFDALVNRWLVYPVNIGGTGKVKTCEVGSLVHGIITKIARKQHMVKTSLSHHLARHFSIFNDLRLRGSDKIHIFFRNLSESSQLCLLKVLDLEGCLCFGKKQSYLKVICSKMLLLKFLSLRGTDVSQIPSEINDLQVLEVLDIRQTKVPASATKHILLLKLKRLLAGNSDTSPSSTDDTSMTKELSAVRVPNKVGKFVNMEVLSNVKASQTGQELKDIGKLWQLRKLGVVIDNRNGHLINLLQAISDLHECLRSLSISLSKGAASSSSREVGISSPLTYYPELLESLSISGTTEKVQLLPLLTKYGNQLSKLTLCSTGLHQGDLNVLYKLPKLFCVRLRCNAYSERKLTFMTEEFTNLSYFLVEGSNMTEISFDGGAPELKKIVLSFTNIEYIGGVDNLPKLEELELRNNSSRLLSFFDNANQIAKVTLCGTSLKQCDLQMLAEKPNLRCLVLMENSYVEKQLNFYSDEFPQLTLLAVNCSDVTNISFNERSAANLEKIVCIFTKMDSLSGISHLRKLKELEFKGDIVPKDVEEAFDEYEKLYKRRPDYKYSKQKNQDQQKENAPEEDNVSKCPLFWKSKG
ncbi:uncharacterized protein LOC120694988 [Panicum virgatum]|uniref:Rx N-terminal domain-containing protein n=1 Tax=Panicum virgatum TaxID=38727 RepID=A0A8T0WAE9_PANVG|nr:uncharacterized protein LOC120694988 [Panicum virgatum]KAG2640199.1 hypothetical protein PVAP13_2KG057600 [Panicum virgatum]